MIRLPPRSTRTATLLPYSPLCRATGRQPRLGFGDADRRADRPPGRRQRHPGGVPLHHAAGPGGQATQRRGPAGPARPARRSGRVRQAMSSATAVARSLTPGLPLVLGGLAALGALSTNIILPSFPHIAADLCVATTRRGITMRAVLLVFASWQLAAG